MTSMTHLLKRQAGHIARTEWESHIAAKKPVKQKKAVAETGDEEVKNTKKEAVKPEKKCLPLPFSKKYPRS